MGATDAASTPQHLPATAPTCYPMLYDMSEGPTLQGQAGVQPSSSTPAGGVGLLDRGGLSVLEPPQSPPVEGSLSGAAGPVGSPPRAHMEVGYLGQSSHSRTEH